MQRHIHRHTENKPESGTKAKRKVKTKNSWSRKRSQKCESSDSVESSENDDAVSKELIANYRGESDDLVEDDL